MKREIAHSIIRRLVDHVVADTTDLASEPYVVAAEHFIDPARHAQEREQFFLDTPQAVGFVGQVAEPGSYFATEVVDVPIVVLRDRDGVLRAFLNVCTHRGARVATGCGKARRLVCGFHGWSFGLDGKLAGRGRSDDFEPDAINTALQPLPVADCGGIVMVGLRPEMGPLRVEHALDDIAPHLENMGLEAMQHTGSDRFEVAANWKLVVNLSHEGYHFAALHGESLGPMMTGHGVADQFGLHTRWAFPLRGIEALAEKDEADWPDFPPAAMNHTLFPGTVIVANAGGAQMIRVEPGSRPDTSVVYFSAVAPVDASASDEAKEAARATYEFGKNIFVGEDLPAAVECQRGIESRGQPIVIGRNELVVQWWHERWLAELDDVGDATPS
ncbi:MAG: aromatic ring-hydroxylating dioxygenase subunit alpha [Myxococcota bacterium]|jgi:phenylpropionate dioxygenase-like ring-hydroxylating dioxygenase large terminal subunit|nr:aromatic ring-hydroxylating dioxygenase subunit alpha [Myxococcota bacterium]